MMRFIVLCAAAMLAVASCGSEWHMPFSNVNPAAPTLELGSSSQGARAHHTAVPAPTGVANAAPAGLRNEGTQVWLVPVPAGDIMRLAQNPELWPTAAGRVDVLSIFYLHAYHHEGFECGLPCGPNTYLAMLEAVPGGFFKWASERFILGMETGSVKQNVCTTEAINSVAFHANIALANVKKAGGLISYISLDEPFASGTASEDRSPFGGSYIGCNLKPEAVALLQKQYNDGVHKENPEVQIGIIEPYPHFTVDEIMSYLLELERVGINIPYFHLDFDQPRAVREDSNWKSDIGRLREFCRAKGIPFGVILVGWDGRSNEQFAAGYWGVARTTLQAVGVTEHTVLQSWAEDPPGDLNSLKHIPDTVPESSEVSHTGLLLRTLELLGVKQRK